MEKLRVALVGAGGRGKSHANAIANAPNIEFVAVCDLDATTGKEVADQYGIEYIPNTTELYARDDIAAVGICVQTRLHHKMAMEALEAGRHIVTEKPMAASISEAKEMVAAVAEAGVVAALSYQLRFGPLYAKMKELCEQIEPLQIFFARQRGMLLDKYMSPEPFDGIMDFISHDIDMVPFLAGKKPTALLASLRRNTWGNADAIEVAGVQIELGAAEDKTVGCISSSMGGAGIPERLDVVGKNGIAYKVGNTIHFAVGPNPPAPLNGARLRDRWSMSFEGEPGDFTRDLYEHWAASVLDASVPLAPAASYEDGYNALLMTLAIAESGNSGEKVQLEEFAASLG